MLSLSVCADCMEQSFLTYEEMDMAVFKEKNGAMKGVAIRANRQAREFGPACPLSSKALPRIPRGVRDSANERNVRAAATTSNGSIRKGGASEKNN